MRAAALALALALVGCASSNVHLTARQGLLVAEAGAVGLNQSAVVAAHNGLHGADAARVKLGLDGANNAVDAAHTAETQGLANVPALVTSALTAIADTMAAIRAAAPAAPPK